MQLFTASHNVKSMKQLLFLTIFCGTIFGNSGVFSKAGVGLYFDAAYAPSWRGCFPATPLVYKTEINNSEELGLRFGKTLFAMNQGCEEFAPGLKVRADLSANRKGSVQAIFFGLYQWNFNRLIEEANEERIGFSIPPFGQEAFGVSHTFKTFREVNVQYLEHFNSAEASYLQHPTPRYYDYFSVSILYGVRGMQQDNKIELSGLPDPLLGGPRNDVNALMSLNNVNRLIGLQLGGNLRYRMTKRIYLEIPLKCGGYGNLLDYSIAVGYPALDPNDTTTYFLKTLTDQNKTRVFGAASVETAPHMEIHFGRMYVYIGGSYLYVYGISQGIDQIKRNNITAVNACDNFTLASILAGVGVHF